MMKYLTLAVFALGSLLAACDTPTGSTCPPLEADRPTYASFGQAFFTEYCTDCHSANSPNRHDAPGEQNYDTEADIKKHAIAIDVEAASGPDATNTAMPQRSPNVLTTPSVEERKLLGQYLACLKAQ